MDDVKLLFRELLPVLRRQERGASGGSKMKLFYKIALNKQNDATIKGNNITTH